MNCNMNVDVSRYDHCVLLALNSLLTRNRCHMIVIILRNSTSITSTRDIHAYISSSMLTSPIVNVFMKPTKLPMVDY